ncbi:Binding-protein-dependent transport systems inner membrane component [Acidipropionibacterium acidipropionici ATCC 4875]|uniref:Binding-protein-dependent transport systems inner membrane component n=1 Tax=Acidipropionibacterium acidipropionici (strain ATCC 4875 / DSM 20272 / JCM 6432 / NBRC 12425 / NCIMB 8070 / 4) TaxID=1171373 RepID=K7SP07_ACIA4|nr:sugar ABC transporter permease [Acidipropionibacterium acidipropionici]AFV90935.1 Binding-protein-dependent transport systems inner membrane component [Acidipropionibacterium acidipropionici ATCC 4875]
MSRQKISTESRKEERFAYLLLLPTFIVLALVVGFPLVLSLWQSFFKTGSGINPETGLVEKGDKFVGLQNYSAVFANPDASQQFWNAFGNTTLLTVVGVLVETVLGVIMALIMVRGMRGLGWVRAGILVPWAIPTIVSALMWKLIFNADGVFNRLIGHQVLWTTEGWQAKAAILIADIWKTAPYIGLLTLAGLQTIDTQVYEAAKVDGASPWKTFWRITLPLVRPVLVVAVLFRTLDAMRMFDLPYGLLGMLDSGKTLSMLSWYEAGQSRYGEAAAYSLYLFAYICLAVFVFVKVLGADIMGDQNPDKKKRKKLRGSGGAGAASSAGPAIVSATSTGSATGSTSGSTPSAGAPRHAGGAA